MKKNKYQSLFTIALVLDFASPKVPSILKQKYTPRGDYKKVIVYPLRASSPSTDIISDCNHVIGLNVKPEEIAALGKQWTHAPDTPLPLTEAIKKIDFEVEYHLRTLDQIIFVTSGKKDSCGEDPCEALAHLRATATKFRRKIRFQMIGPLVCPKGKNNFLAVIDSNGLSLAQVVANGKGLKTTPKTDLPMAQMPKIATKAKVASKPKPSPHPKPLTSSSALAMAKASPSPSPSGPQVAEGEILDNDLQLEGPPLTITLTKDKQTLRLTSPAMSKVPTGDWEMKVVSPSWLKNVPSKKIHLDERVLYQLDLKEDLKNMFVWVDSLDEEDQVILLGDPAHQRKILVPAGSPSVPLPKGSQWKVVK